MASPETAVAVNAAMNERRWTPETRVRSALRTLEAYRDVLTDDDRQRGMAVFAEPTGEGR